MQTGTSDPRGESAKFYDLDPGPDDVPFYVRRVPSPAARALELGCGTGRVTVPLARHCASIVGIDHSDAMLRICRQKLAAGGIRNADVRRGDISDFRLAVAFDYVIAPYRVIQNLQTDAQAAGLFTGIREHLRPGGRCILNAYRPNASADALIARWSVPEESLDWEVPIDGGKVACYVRRRGVQARPLVFHPELIYRHFRGDRLVEEARLQIAMRCYFPDEFLSLIRGHGFAVTATFGGYAGEAYGEGGELVVEFEAED